MLEYIDAGTLRIMFLAGAKNLESKKDWINELNVFPVPDGDTGTNMFLTMKSAVNEVNNCPSMTIEALSQAFAPASADSGFAAQSGPVEIPVDSFGRSPAEEDKEGLWNLPPILRSKSE